MTCLPILPGMSRTRFIVIVGALVAATLIACGSGSAKQGAASKPDVVPELTPEQSVPVQTKRAKPTPTAEAKPVEMPIIDGMLLSGADALAPPQGLTAYDARPILSGGRERGVFARSNWVVVANCPRSGARVGAKDEVKVWVLKLGELAAGERRKITSGEYQDLFKC